MKSKGATPPIPLPPEGKDASVSVRQLARRWRWTLDHIADWLCEDRVPVYLWEHAITVRNTYSGHRQLVHGFVRLTSESIHELAANRTSFKIGIMEPGGERSLRGMFSTSRYETLEGTWRFGDLRIKTSDIALIEGALAERRARATQPQRDVPPVGSHPATGADTSAPGEHGNPRKSQLARASVRAVAALLWRQHPGLNIEGMVSNADLRTFGLRAMGHRDYAEATVREWIRDLCPNPKAGRPRKSR